MGNTGLFPVGVVLFLVALRNLPLDQSDDVLQGMGANRPKPWDGRLNAFHGTYLRADHVFVWADCDLQHQHFAGHGYKWMVRLFLVLRNHAQLLPKHRGGGWIFAYCPYVLYDMNGKPSLITLWALPILILLAIKYAKSGISDRRFIVLCSLILTSLFYTTDEIFVTFVFMSSITMLAAIYLYRETAVGGRLVNLCKLSIISLLITAVPASPFIYYGLFGPGAFLGAIHNPNDFSNDLMSLVIPSSFNWLGGAALHREFLRLHGWQLDDYLGPAVLLLMVFFFIQFRKRRCGKLIIIMVLISLVLSFGPHLAIYGHATTIGLPFWVLFHVPVLNKAVFVCTRTLEYSLPWRSGDRQSRIFLNGA